MNVSARFLLYAAFWILLTCNVQAQWQIVRQDDTKCDNKGSRCDLNAVFFADKENGWIVGDRGIIRATQNEGERWSAQESSVKTAISDVVFLNKKDGFLVASGARIYRTLDGGNTWSADPIFQIVAPKNVAKQDLPELYSLAFPSKKKGWVVGTEGRIFHTEDGGQSWAQQESGTKEELVHVRFINDKYGWIVGGKGIILFTEDSGRTWAKQTSGAQSHLYHIDAISKKEAVIVGDGGLVLRTENGGLSWDKVKIDILDSFKPKDRPSLLSVAFVNDDLGFIIGFNGTVLRTGDGGKTWLQQESGTKQNLYGLVAKKKAIWAVGGDGLILRYQDK
ncbi:MAG: hypothetical protein JNM09_19010 [Blastocatellia bacterium]|nr:hypothetical protein [Blastocatellia bacterium]